MSDDQLKVAFDDLWRVSSERTWIVGRLGVREGGGVTVDVPGRAGYVYVSKGVNGELGQAVAKNAVGATGDWTQIKMRRELGQLVIREADNLAGGGTTTFAALTDVDLTGLADGDTIQWHVASSKWIPVAPGGGGGAPSPHDLDSIHHTGTLSWANVNKTGSNLADLATRSHSSLTGVNPNDHHNQVHSLVGSDHTASGLTAGHVVRASGATTFAWAQLQHGDLGGVTANQHHNQQHSITGSDHTITASQYQVVGATAINTLGLLTPSSNPGAAVAILRTDSNGGIALDTTLFVVNGLTNVVSVDGSLFSADAANDLVTVGTNLLYADVPNKRLGVNRTPGNAAIDAIANANADHTLRVKQKSGQSGRLWRVEDAAGNELIVLDSQGNLQSGKPGFVSGLTGWQVTPTGNAEFNNIWARGELHATVFVKDEVHVSGGTLLVANGARLYSDATIDSTTVDVESLEVESTVSGVSGPLGITTTAGGFSGTTLSVEGIVNFIEVEDSPTGAGFYFEVGVTVRSKTEVTTGITDFWFTIVSRTQLSGYQRYRVIKQSGTDGVLPAGAALADYGVEGDGRILLTSDLNYAPYMEVFTIGPNVWTGAAGSVIPHLRVGRLDGVGVTGTSGVRQYGIIAGTDLSDANSPYAVLSNLQLRLHRVNYTANDGTNDTVEIAASGNVTVGTNIAVTAGKAFSVQTTGTDAGDVVIGDHALAGNYLKWDKSAGTLTINGALSVGGVGVATTSYVGSQIAIVDAAAAGYAASAQSAAIAAAQSYSNARRVVGVSGTFTSTDADTITWTSVSVRFGDGNTKSITNGNTGNMSAGTRTYLYVDATATAPLTLSATTNLASIGANNALIAVCDPGTDKASVSIVAGSTYISGDNIITGSIVAANIKAASITGDRLVANTITATQIAAATITATELAANSVTAAKINVSSLSAVNANTGALTVSGNITVGTSGAIFSSGKTAAFSSTAGFFLGRESGEYRFGIGNNNAYIYWDGSNLDIKTIAPPVFNTAFDGSSRAFLVTDGTVTKSITYASNLITLDPSFATNVRAKKFIVQGDTFQIEQKRTPASYTATGLAGEVCWDDDYLYLCIATNLWTRHPNSVGAW